MVLKFLGKNSGRHASEIFTQYQVKSIKQTEGIGIKMKVKLISIRVESRKKHRLIMNNNQTAHTEGFARIRDACIHPTQW